MSKLLIANWKMNGDAMYCNTFVKRYADAISIASRLHTVVCPPSLYLYKLVSLTCDRGLTQYVSVGAQNCWMADSGAYTGEIACRMLCDVGVTHVIIGHSERRRLFNESQNNIINKVVAAVNVGLVPIICVGEGEGDRYNACEYTKNQVAEIVFGFASKLQKSQNNHKRDIIFAYEPIWAVGGNDTPSAEHIMLSINSIRDVVMARGDGWLQYNIVYGGAINVNNLNICHDIMRHVDGLMVGRVSMDVNECIKIATVIADFVDDDDK